MLTKQLSKLNSGTLGHLDCLLKENFDSKSGITWKDYQDCRHYVVTPMDFKLEEKKV